MSTTQDPVSATAMVVERAAVAEHLLDPETEIEPFVMLESASEGARVRKLTVVEKLAHSERTGEGVFFADEHEQNDFFALLDRHIDGA
jgi:hypothetical protein